ncbi:MAG TPA: fluoride efflux transporter CrcB [Salinimicrobium sp.]|nr:fluoride efflux transporter CrcB [Salinimicrobium sp.]
MKDLLLVFLGGGAGSVLRFMISRSLSPVSGFPMGTFTVNIIGCLLIGLILGLGQKYELFSPGTTLLLVTGFCGGFTTFSTFAFENQQLLRSGDILNFSLYTLASIALGIAAVVLGLFLSGALKS